MPTRAGLAALSAGAVIFALSLVLGYLQVGVLGIGGMLAAVLASAETAARRWWPAATVSRVLSRARVTRGETVDCVLTARNDRRWPLPSTVIHDRLAGRPVAVRVPFLRPGATATVRYRLHAERRGVFDVGPLRWEPGDLLGLARWEHIAGDVQGLRVHPATHPMVIAFQGPVRGQGVDGGSGVLVPGGAAYHGLREYRAGDDLRHVHWASSAKRGVLVVKESLDTGSPDVHVLLDVSRPAYDDEPCFEEAVEAAASALVAAVKAGFGARLTAGDGTVNWGGDVRHVLDHMAGLAAAAAGPSPARLVGALPRVRDGAILLLVTGGITDEDLAALHHAAPRYRRTGALVLHAADTESTTDAEGVALIAASRAARVCARWNALGAAS